MIDLVSSIAISRYRYFIYNGMNQTAYRIIAYLNQRDDKKFSIIITCKCI